MGFETKVVITKECKCRSKYCCINRSDASSEDNSVLKVFGYSPEFCRQNSLAKFLDGWPMPIMVINRVKNNSVKRRMDSLLLVVKMAN